MTFKLESVFERDIDLLVINKFLNDESFKDLFLKIINKIDYKVVDCIHSFSDENGESDITIILENGNDKVGLLLEDKINAIAMPKQYERYHKRGKKLVKQGLFNNYYVFIIAPKEYLDSNSEAKKYDHQISYEEIQEHIKNDLYGYTLLEKAIKEKKKSYSIIEDKKVTLFWNNLYEFVEKNYPELQQNKVKGPRGANAQWPIFITPVKKVTIVLKSDRGYCDLKLPSLGDKYFDVNKIIGDKLEKDMHLMRTGKSLSIRINVPIIKFTDGFQKQESKVIECLNAALRLQDLMKEIDFRELLNLTNR